MVKTDDVDKKILFYLNQDSRISFKELSDLTNISKSAIFYRINRLEKNKIILNYTTAINPFILGYTCYRIYIQFQNITPETENLIIDHFKRQQSTIVVASLSGKFDLVITVLVKDTNMFYDFYHATIDIFGDNFKSIIFSLYIKWHTFENLYLLDEKNIKGDRKFQISERSKEIIIDNVDFNILKILSTNSRIRYTELAAIVGCTSATIHHRIRELKNKNILQRFGISYDFRKIGYNWFKTDIYLKNNEHRQQIINYVMTIPNLWKIDTTIGYADLEFEFHFNNIDRAYVLLNEISKRFPDSIRRYDILTLSKIHKYIQHPSFNKE